MPPPDTTREFYAGLAMQGIVASGRVNEVSERAAERIAAWAFVIADKMIAASTPPPAP